MRCGFHRAASNTARRATDTARAPRCGKYLAVKFKEENAYRLIEAPNVLLCDPLLDEFDLYRTTVHLSHFAEVDFSRKRLHVSDW